jgi:hypothetical protein
MIRVVTSKARSAWDQLLPHLRQQIEQELGSYPKHDRRYPRAREHIKGKIAGKNRRCRREYKRLPGAWRVFYSVNEDAREIEIEYIGEHPK